MSGKLRVHIFVCFQQNLLIEKKNNLGSKTLNLNVSEAFNKLLLSLRCSRDLKGNAQFLF